ncbi:conjugal transfer pilus assembly protein TraE [Geothermobacter ehrlichii]|uniref:Conjugal transfer pilus assembly protein TraE n=1 Tax=Geothermobacter ehrlichii TaxID=213224 RepID=A0A5D3WKG7_9BACT|nr:type IV conjugative transfer system protein TraE [Geothermobacter ehrlichii]TYO96793.1 conjugal transfer pilus assembly protein TraE [Geothermobacter ehrlichii]
MRLDLFIQKSSNLFATNRLLMLIVVLIGGLTLFNTLMLQVALNRQAVVLVPPGLKDRASLTASTISEDYAREMARYVTSLLLTYSPGTIRRQYEEVLALIAPEKFAEMQKALMEAVDTVEVATVSRAFFVTRMELKPDEKVIEVTGIEKTFVQDQKTDERQKVYAIGFSVRGGRFYVTSFEGRDLR